MVNAPPTTVEEATPVMRRSPAPDLARGTMLLFIALAHAHMFLLHSATGFRGYSVDGGVIDRIVAGVQVLLVDGRALPMFAALFGYGVVQMMRRRADAGASWPTARRLARRRSWWLLLFGLCHALLLFFGDILGAYGFIGLLFIGLLNRRDRVLLWAAGIGVAVHIAVIHSMGWVLVETDPGATDLLGSDPVTSAVTRVGVWLMMTFALLPVSVITPFFVGAWAARRRLLEDPQRHERLLARTAGVGIAVALIGGAPLASIDTGLWTPAASIQVAAYSLHSVTGIAGGLGLAAFVGWLTVRRTRPHGPIATALAATGQRSLTCYLLQSVLFVAIFASYAGGLNDRLSDAQASGVAVLVWLSTVVLAAWMARTGRRGPFEVLLRRLTYGRHQVSRHRA